MKVTVLGCGSAHGVPHIGNDWGNCDPNDPRNRRTRVSILIEQGGKTVLIDTGPDMRQQLLNCDLKRLDAVLYTHEHADHCHGIDELRSMNWLMNKPIDIYASPRTLCELEKHFPYIFHGANNGYHPASITPHKITGPFSTLGLDIIPFEQTHGNITSLGFRIGDFAYSTDVNMLDEKAFACLKGIKTWVVDCLREEPHPTHSHLSQTLEWIARVKPERAYFTHMNKLMDYKTIAAKLPSGVWPAYDGLVLECKP